MESHQDKDVKHQFYMTYYVATRVEKTMNVLKMH